MVSAVEQPLPCRLFLSRLPAAAGDTGCPFSVLDLSAQSSCAGSRPSADELHRGYKSALRQFHPDRALRRQEPWQQVAETEEVSLGPPAVSFPCCLCSIKAHMPWRVSQVYKLLQTLYEAHRENLAAVRSTRQHASGSNDRNNGVPRQRRNFY